MAIIDAGPAGIDAAGTRSESALEVSTRLFERTSAPVGQVLPRGVPDGPRIKQITAERLDLLLRPRRGHPGHRRDPGRGPVDLRHRAARLLRHGGRGARHDGHPDVPRGWPLTAQHVARIAAKHAHDFLPTEIPEDVHQGLVANPVTPVNLCARYGTAQGELSPLELGHAPGVDVLVYPEGFDFERVDGRHPLVQPDHVGRQDDDGPDAQGLG